MENGGKSDGKGGCLKGRRGQRKDEKASYNFSTGMGARWNKKTGNFKGKSWMEKGERFEKGGLGGKVNVGRWKDRWKGWMFEGKERTKRERRQKKNQRGRGPVAKKNGNFEGKSWMEKGERFEKGGPGGKVKVGRWKNFFLQGKLRNTTGSSSRLSIKFALFFKAHSSLQQSQQDLWFPSLPFQRFQALLTLFLKSFSSFPHGKVGERRDEVEGWEIWERGAGALRGGVEVRLWRGMRRRDVRRVGLVAEQDPQKKGFQMKVPTMFRRFPNLHGTVSDRVWAKVAK